MSSTPGMSYPFAGRYAMFWNSCHVTYEQAVEMFNAQTAHQQMMGHSPLVSTKKINGVIYETMQEAQRAFSRSTIEKSMAFEKRLLEAEVNGCKDSHMMLERIRNRYHPTESGQLEPNMPPLKEIGEDCSPLFFDDKYNNEESNEQVQKEENKEVAKECYRYIAIAASQYENGSNKMNFIGQAVRYLRKSKNTNPSAEYSLILVTPGYTDNEVLLAEKSCLRYQFNLVKVTSLGEITNNLSKNECLIEKLAIFSHGIPLSIELGYKTGEQKQHLKELTINQSTLNFIPKEKLTKTAMIESFACRTGMGNISDTKIKLNDYVDIFGLYGDNDIEDGVQFDPEPEKSLAQMMANYYDRSVKAFITRTNYDKTWGSKTDIIRYKACNITEDIGDEDWCEARKKREEDRDASIDEFNTLYDIEGAMNDVYVGFDSTPLTIGEKEKVFQPQ